MICRAPSILAAAVLLLAAPAGAVVVRGRVIDPLGRPLAGARVQLIRGPRNVADAIIGLDGSYEIRLADSGRFLLLTSSPLNARHPAVQIGAPFYAGRTDQVERTIALDAGYLTPQVSALATLLPTPLPKLAEATTQVAADQFLTAASPVPALRQLPSTVIVQRGTAGTPAELYLRGAGPGTVKVRIAGAAAEDFGGGFNLATLSTLGLAAIAPTPAVEQTAGALPLAGVQAQGGELAFHQAEATGVRPALTITADAGNLSTLRGEATGEVTLRRADLRGGFSRFDTDSGAPALSFHQAAAVADLGYNISGGTSLRLQAQRDVAAAPLAVPLALYGVQPAGKDAAQNLYASLAFDTVSAHGWHNRLAYGLTRKRRQVEIFSLPATGIPVTVVGANGYAASGIAAFPPLPPRRDGVTDRDQVSFETDYRVKENHTALLRLSFEDERAADLEPARASGPTAGFRRRHLAAQAGFQGKLFAGWTHRRLFYEASGLVDDSHPLGWLGAPRVGLTLVPVFPGVRRLRGTTLHAVAATGFGEPGVRELEFARAAGVEAAGIRAAAPRSRTFSFGADQVVLPQKLTLRVTYFHGQFSHQPEVLAFDSVSPSAAYRAQGIETAVHYQPFPRVYVAGGYTYLAAQVEQTAESPAFNPALPGAAIGALGALAGARPFHRPPNSGWFAARFTGERLSLAVGGSAAGRSDSSSGLAGTPALLLPNRNLSPGYAELTARAMYRFSTHVAVYTQLDNLLDDRHVAPFGFLLTPFAVRAGLRLQLGGD